MTSKLVLLLPSAFTAAIRSVLGVRFLVAKKFKGVLKSTLILDGLFMNMHKIFIAFFLGVFLAVPSLASSSLMENLGRGLIAAYTSSGMLVSWRLLGTDDPEATFTLYRDGVQIASIDASDPTTYLDSKGSVSSDYTLKDASGKISSQVTVFNNLYTNTYGNASYKTITLDVPADLTMPDASTCTYYPNDMSVGDLDGDGEYELVVKWDPSNSKDNSSRGYTGNVYIDAYKIDGTKLWRIDLGHNIRAGAHYTQFMVYDLDGDGIAEVVMKTSDGTVDGVGKVIGNSSADYRTTGGLIMSGNEYLTVFNGKTGAAITTIDYWPSRSVQAMTSSGWGDNYANRSERMLAAIAYLDGIHPSVIMCRGYYTYAYLAAYTFDGSALTKQWTYSSPKEAGLYGEGNHNLSVADLDGDGYDEIVYGASALNHDGTLRYRTGLGHGDALHVSDMNPDRNGLETWDVHEETSATYSAEMRAGDGTELLTVAQTGSDNGRGLAADIDSNYRGFEMWSAADANVYNAVTGKSISTTVPSINFRVYWDGDLYDELFDGTSSDKGAATGTGGKLEKWNDNGVSRILNLYGVNNSTTNNSTKSNPCLIADILGDYREEIIMRSSANAGTINIIETPVTTPHRVYALMHDRQYRESIAWQNVAYNQPPHLSYYLPDRADNGLVKPSITLVGVKNPTLALTGTARQSITLGNSIAAFLYTFTNCSGVTIEGLPKGLDTATVNGVISISGTPTESGTFAFTATTVGFGEGATGVTLSGLISVLAEGETVPSDTMVSYFNAAVPDAGDGGYEETNTGWIDSGYYNFSNTATSYATWDFYSKNTTAAVLYVRFANGSTDSRNMMLVVNGNTIQSSMEFPSTGAWTTWAFSTAEIALLAGKNTISFYSTTSNGGPNIDILGFNVDGILRTDQGSALSKVAKPISANFNVQTGNFISNLSGIAYVKVFDLRGRMVSFLTADVEAGKTQKVFSSASLSNGLYLVQIKLGSKLVASSRVAISK